MATPSRLIFFNPSSMLFLTLALSVIIFFGVVSSVILIDNGQNKNLVNYEIKILLQNNGQLVEKGNYREFSQLIPENNKFYMSVFNFKDKKYFNVGNPKFESSGLCSNMSYFAHEIVFCRERLIPWKIIIPVSIIFLVLLGIAVTVSRRSEKQVLSSLIAILESAHIKIGSELNIAKAWALVDGIAEEIPAYRKKEIEYEKNKITSNLARQVAHDIRSPLSTLNLLSGAMKELPEQKRNLVKNSIQQINDIANDLLIKANEARNSHEFSVSSVEDQAVKLTDILLEAVEEKEIQNKVPGILIKADLQISNELNVGFPKTDLKRILSNLLNNSIESFAEQGLIVVSAKKVENHAIIQIADNGRGIPQDILAKLGKVEITYGKVNTQSGSGLGVYHAKRTIERYGGELSIYSKVDEGTVVSIRLDCRS